MESQSIVEFTAEDSVGPIDLHSLSFIKFDFGRLVDLAFAGGAEFAVEMTKPTVELEAAGLGFVSSHSSSAGSFDCPEYPSNCWLCYPFEVFEAVVAW